MELLTSDILPLRSAMTRRSSLPVKFLKLMSDADSIKIATGFVSSESVVELHDLIRRNLRPSLDMFIGMHHFSTISRKQYSALDSLNSYLTEAGLGVLRVSTVLPFHGKVYGFYREGRPFAAVIGSSNLDGLFPFHGFYEADILVDEGPLLDSLSNLLTRDIPGIATNFRDWPQPVFRDEGTPPLSEFDGAETVFADEVQRVRARVRTNRTFDIPLKIEPRSNLNVFFGKGRRSTRTGIVVPRNWYEVEIIVPVSITSLPGYPYKRSFTVVTDDGFSFDCRTSGDYSKNLRSKNSLRTLGKWIKGRLENAGALDPGKPVTEEVFERYGRSTISLIATQDPDIWYLDFAREGA